MCDLIKKASPRKDRVEINGAIREVIELTYSEAVKNGVSVQTQFAESLPLIQGDRVQLQQVMLNLIINAIQAMSGVAAGVRELRITMENTELEGVRLAVRRLRPRAEFGELPTSVRAILYDQARGHGHGPIYLPLDHRSPRRTAVGDPVRTAGCSLSVYDPCHLSGRIVIDVALWHLADMASHADDVRSRRHRDRSGLHDHGGGEAPHQQDREREADRREDRHRRPARRPHRSRVGEDGKRGQQPVDTAVCCRCAADRAPRAR